MGSELDQKTSETSIVDRTWIGSIFSTLWNYTGGWFTWTRQSDAMLRCVEKQILSCLKTAYKRFYVDIGSVVGRSDKIWTISLNDESTKTPLVMLHGMGAGLALWCPNLDSFATTRPVYAFDLLGFGRSSRPKFSSDAAKVEAQWVESVEEWRREVNIGEFILLGHSLGGYIATAYAMKYPERVRHLILADPWGFPEKPNNPYEKYQVPFWVRAVATAVQPLNPLWMVRAAGPAGKWLVSKTRPDISRKYLKYVPDAEKVIPEYIYQCNSQSPSGESAFHTLMDSFGWAKHPMVKRVHKLDPALPVTVLYGSRSWVDNATGHVLKEERQSNQTYVQVCYIYSWVNLILLGSWVDNTIGQLLNEERQSNQTYVQVINGAGHHVYLDKPEQFNKYVSEACARADHNETMDDFRKDVAVATDAAEGEPEPAPAEETKSPTAPTS